MIWLTYKKDFRPLLIEKAEVQGKKLEHLSSDCGWGCTIRSAQMLIANTLARTKSLGREAILKLFDDSERGAALSAFSIQNVAVEGLEVGKLPGDWYGVNTICNLFEKLNERYQPVKQFKICNFQDGNIICDRIKACA